MTDKAEKTETPKAPKVKKVKRKRRKNKVTKTTVKAKNVSGKIITSMEFLTEQEQGKVLALVQKLINKKLKKIMQ